MDVKHRIMMVLEMDPEEYEAVRRGLQAIAPSDHVAARLCAQFGGDAPVLMQPIGPVIGGAVPMRPYAPSMPGVGLDPLPEPELDPATVPRPKPIDPLTLPADDPRRVEAEKMHGRWGGPSPAGVDHSPD